MVKKDREFCGATFNSKLDKVFKNTRKSNSESNRGIDPKQQRPLFYDDMDDEDGSGQEDTNEHVSFVRVFCGKHFKRLESRVSQNLAC
jgi:hypothetical protein